MVAMSLWLRNLLFTVVVPGLGGLLIPWWILAHSHATLDPAAWYAIAVIVLGAALYFWCLWAFAIVGRGTPGPWDPPRRFVAAGPYRWVRNPMYIAALTSRIPPMEAPASPESPQAPGTATEQPGSVEPQAPLEGAQAEPSGATERRKWWRRMFGFD